MATLQTRLRVSGCLIIVLLVCLPKNYAHGGISGTEWNALPPIAQTSYIAGIVDAWQAVDALLASGELDLLRGNAKRLTECLEKKPMPYAQLSAVFAEYLREHPERWDLNASLLSTPVIIRACLMSLEH